MSTGSLSDVEDLQEVEMLECDGLKMDTNKEFGASTESNEEGSNGENGSPQKGRGASGKRKKAPPKKSPLNGVSQEGKQVQRNAANARERARMRVLSKAFSRLKTTLPWVPPDTKLSKLDTLRLASSYIAHLRQILANDKYENGYIHPVNLSLIHYLYGNGSDEMLSQETALGEVNIVYKKVLMKLRKPRITATIWSSGKVICTGATSEEEAKFGARRLARSLQKLGFQVIFTDFKVVNVLAVCNMPFEIRLPEFTKNNRPHASYEPELHPAVCYRIKSLRATLQIFSTGSITVTGPNVKAVASAVEQIYPFVFESRK
ncbi:hypothetical protein HGM15179_000262 [Zosterops borbonicus]|uniref:TATA box-binding protein-like 1 n=9 Tax=Neoaves TaxID=3078114 RepID=A0A8K1LUQ5_9PASS|nr:hypothetical protein HGM15179_000262 [Zosterops borbonicus]